MSGHTKSTQFFFENLSYWQEDYLLFSELAASLGPGDFLELQGPNGSGKTTLLRILLGILSPDEGCIFWQNRNIVDLGFQYSRHLHYLSHKTMIKPLLNLKENLLLWGLDPDLEILKREVKNLDLPEKQACYTYSQGQLRKLTLLRLSVFRPLWILDEPLTALDQKTQMWFLEKLRLHREQGGMVIMSSHQPFSGHEDRQILSLGEH